MTALDDELRREAGPSAAEIDALVLGRHRDPFAILGPHRAQRGAQGAPAAQGTWIFRTFQPDATKAELVDRDGNVLATASKLHPAGLFEASLDRPPGSYRWRIHWPLGPLDIDDPYRFPPILGDLDVHLWREGRHHRPWDKFGAHAMELDGVAGVAFVVWAPNARRVSVVGDFNQWDGRRHPMRLRHDAGAWELFVPGVAPGAHYKYELLDANGALLPQKADPFAFYAELRPRTGSIVDDPAPVPWNDDAWMKSRATRHATDAPMSIYEVHLGSWRRHWDGNRWYSYRELADTLVPYVSELGFTHVELMPVNEFPFDGSWGYQPTGLYAPTSRHGTPQDFQYLVDRFHQAGIGVIIDYVAAHFPNDPHGLGDFDGTHLYEHADPRQGFHPDWNSLIYNLERPEVVNFLTGAAIYWGERFHIDGLRFDAVASMLYLDYSRNQGEWVPNKFGGRENLAAIEFLRKLNELWYERFPGAMTAAEESTAWPNVSRPTYVGGLGFGWKWNMGWMHDTLQYMSREPVYRPWHQGEITFSLVYAFSENFILPLSHDEVVHGKGSLITKMPGDEWQKFANLRAYYGFMWGHPGKKLLFMGSEFAQRREWNHDTELEWGLLQGPRHAGVQHLVRDLNALFRATPSLHRHDTEPRGFEWIEAADNQNSVIAFLRKGNEGEVPTLVVSNFTPSVRHGYRVGVPGPGKWREALNTDSEFYGGSNVHNGDGVEAEPIGSQGRAWSIALTLPPLATLFLVPTG
ncbi:MAG: 1,4-alpha-glucan branching enzyme [Rhodospirillales bacterium]|nr:1,4-alpha-glucan branching enzyme [Rhodospirillales bacterium]